jgi:hypothetical protein
MNATRALSILRQIVFEPTSAGGGSFWNGDSLLATLTVLKRAERQGHLSLRDANRAMDIVRLARKRHTGVVTTHYRLMERLSQAGEAEWNTGEPSAELRYQGHDYVVTRASLLSVQDHQPVITLTGAPDWNIKQMELHVAPAADLPLVAFFLFVAYDLKG